MAKKMQPAVREISYEFDIGDSYVDLAKDLSIVNRRLYEQGKQYFIRSVEWLFVADPDVVDTIQIGAFTAGDSWVVHNAHTKGKVLWHQMNNLVLKDNPSIEGKWADYKVYLDQNMASGTILTPFSYNAGEWNFSEYVVPQHDVDPATGQPLAADECVAHIIGPTVGAPGALTSVGLVHEYAESRARVQSGPATLAGMAQGFFNLLTDTGSQEPELADVLQDSNDFPPYDMDEYQGGATNAPEPILQEFGVASVTFPNGNLTGFSAECGLVKFVVEAYKDGVKLTEGVDVALMKISVMPGDYKGVAALPMGQ